MSTAEAHPFRLFPPPALLVALLLLLLSSCAPTRQPMGARVAEPAIDAAATEYVAADGARLPLKAWLPEGGAPKAVILALHGFNDYSNAFAAPAKDWAAQGIATYAYDQRGFGRSPRPGIWAGVDTLQADLLGAAAALRTRHPGVPLFLLGESMGAAVVLTTLTEQGSLPAGVSGAILSAPAVWSRDTMPFYQRWALAVASWTVPWYELTPPRGLRIRASDNIEMLRALGRDPLVIKASRVDAVAGLTTLMDQALESAGKLPGPALVLYGENEELIPRLPVGIALSRLPADGVQAAIYPKGFHMLLRDLNAGVVREDIAAWVQDPGRPLPSGAETHPRVLEHRGALVAGNPQAPGKTAAVEGGS